jgi:hypothetical protein
LPPLPITCPTLTTGDITLYTGFFGLTFEGFMQATGLADVANGNFPSGFTPENPEDGVYIIRDSVDGVYSFEAEFREVSATEYEVTMNWTITLQDGTTCTFNITFRIVDGVIQGLVPSADFADITLSAVPTTPINPLPGEWEGQNNQPVIEGCGGFGGFIAAQIGGNVSVGTIAPYTGDWGMDDVIALLESEEPLPAGYVANSPQPNIYNITVNDPEGEINYSFRVISQRRIEFTLSLFFNDPEIGDCRVTLDGFATLDGIEEEVPSTSLPQDGAYTAEVLEFTGCGGAGFETQLESLTTNYTFAGNEDLSEVSLTNTTMGQAITATQEADGTYSGTQPGTTLTFEFISDTVWRQRLTASGCDAYVEFTRVP